jgi:hypothetical protein
MKGIPVKMKVPSHLLVTVYEQKLMLAGTKEEGEGTNKKTVPSGMYSLVSFNPPQYGVETQLQYTDKVFLVDFKRPAGGILNITGATFDNDHYFSRVDAEVTEETIKDTSDAIRTLTEPLTKLTSSAAPSTASNNQANNVSFQTSVVAMSRFDISEPGWEQCARDFVNQHLQGCPSPTSATITHSELQSTPADHFTTFEEQ